MLPLLLTPLAPSLQRLEGLAMFASLVAPFGGFFASAVKRAYNVKDFESYLPGPLHRRPDPRYDSRTLSATLVVRRARVRCFPPKALRARIGPGGV